MLPSCWLSLWFVSITIIGDVQRNYYFLSTLMLNFSLSYLNLCKWSNDVDKDFFNSTGLLNFLFWHIGQYFFCSFCIKYNIFFLKINRFQTWSNKNFVKLFQSFHFQSNTLSSCCLDVYNYLCRSILNVHHLVYSCNSFWLIVIFLFYTIKLYKINEKTKKIINFF